MIGQTVYVLIPLTKRAREWVEENVSYQDWQMVGEVGITIDHRFIADIVEAMEADGLKHGEDFLVR